jgi:hypothetical protein
MNIKYNQNLKHNKYLKLNLKYTQADAWQYTTQFLFLLNSINKQPKSILKDYAHVTQCMLFLLNLGYIRTEYLGAQSYNTIAYNIILSFKVVLPNSSR